MDAQREFREVDNAKSTGDYGRGDIVLGATAGALAAVSGIIFKWHSSTVQSRL
jgi:hypothetical protein